MGASACVCGGRHNAILIWKSRFRHGVGGGQPPPPEAAWGAGNPRQEGREEEVCGQGPGRSWGVLRTRGADSGRSGQIRDGL